MIADVGCVQETVESYEHSVNDVITVAAVVMTAVVGASEMRGRNGKVHRNDSETHWSCTC